MAEERQDFFVAMTISDIATLIAARGTREVPIAERQNLTRMIHKLQEAAKPLPPQLLERGRELYGNDDCEVDTTAAISRTDEDNGTWIQGWLFVHDDELVSDDAGRGANGRMLGGEEHARRVVKELEKIFAGWKGVEESPPVSLTTVSNGVIQIAIGNYVVWDSDGSNLSDLDAMQMYDEYYEEIREQAAVLRLVPSEDSE